MSRIRLRIFGGLAALLLASLLPSAVYGQLGHRVVHDWTIGWGPEEHRWGYSPDSSRFGLIEWEGDVDGTYISWGFGGVMTDWSAATIAGSVGGALGVLLVAGAMTFATFGRRKGSGSHAP